MKKLLLATTAIAGASLISGEALAQTSGPLKLGVGGYFQAYGVGGFQSSDPGQPGAHKRNIDLKREAEIYFLGETKFDNGLVVGVQVELEAETCADQIDESYLYFSGGWGRLILGSENSAAYLLAVGAPAIDSNFDGQDPNYRLFNTGAGFGDPRLNGTSAGQSAIDAYVVNITGDSEKITYLSPRIFGFRGGLSYTPDNSEEASVGQVGAKGGSFAGMPRNDCTPNNAPSTACTLPSWGDVIAAGLNYENQLGPVFLQAAVGYEYGFLESSPAIITTQFGDRQAVQAGVDVGVAGFHVGGGWYMDDNGGKEAGTQTAWAVGLTYTIGPLTVGGSYYNARKTRATFVSEIPAEKLQRVVLGARYDLAPGVDLRGSLQYYGLREGQGTIGGATGSNANNNDAMFAVFGTNVRF